MCVSGYMKFENRDGRQENIFILLKVLHQEDGETRWWTWEIPKYA